MTEEHSKIGDITHDHAGGAERPVDITTDGEPKRCQCGYTRDHYMVSAERQYGFWGWFWLFFMTAGATPQEIIWRCRRCSEVLSRSKDPKVLNANRG